MQGAAPAELGFVAPGADFITLPDRLALPGDEVLQLQLSPDLDLGAALVDDAGDLGVQAFRLQSKALYSGNAELQPDGTVSFPELQEALNDSTRAHPSIQRLFPGSSVGVDLY